MGCWTDAGPIIYITNCWCRCVYILSTLSHSHTYTTTTISILFNSIFSYELLSSFTFRKHKTHHDYVYYETLLYTIYTILTTIILLLLLLVHVILLSVQQRYTMYLHYIYFYCDADVAVAVIEMLVADLSRCLCFTYITKSVLNNIK